MTPPPSCPRLSRASTSCLRGFGEKDVDGRDKPGHDAGARGWRLFGLRSQGPDFVMGDLDVADPVGQLDVFRQDSPIHPDGETTLVLADADAGEILNVLKFLDDLGLGGPGILYGRCSHGLSRRLTSKRYQARS